MNEPQIHLYVEYKELSQLEEGWNWTTGYAKNNIERPNRAIYHVSVPLSAVLLCGEGVFKVKPRAFWHGRDKR